MTATMHSLLVIDGLQGLEFVDPVAEDALAPVPVPTSTATILARLASWAAGFERGQAAKTVKAVRGDWGQYLAWCDGTGNAPLPASPEQLHAFLTNAMARGRKTNTLRRYAYTVGLIHTAAGLPSPTKTPVWGSKWGTIVQAMTERRNGAGKADNGNRVKQAGPLLSADVKAIKATLGTRLHDLRDAALIALASDTLMRESELVAVEVEHLDRDRDTGLWTVWVPFSKTNRSGADEDHRFVDGQTIECIRAWQAAAGITAGLLFRAIGGRRRAPVDPSVADEIPSTVRDHALRPPEVARIFRRRAKKAGLEHAASITGHSARVGSANQLLNRGYTAAQIMDAGNWKSPEMVARYTRKSRAGQNAMAKMREAERAEDEK
jgi:integrase